MDNPNFGYSLQTHRAIKNKNVCFTKTVNR